MSKLLITAAVALVSGYLPVVAEPVSDLLKDGYEQISKGGSGALTFQKAIQQSKTIPRHWALTQKNDILFHRICGEMSMAYKFEAMNEEALQLIEAAIESKPGDTTYLLQLGDLQWTKNNIGKAMEAYEKVLDTNPDSAAAWHGTGRCYQNIRKPKEAIRAYERAVEISPNNPKYIQDLARLVAQLGHDMKRALQLFRRASAITPADTEIECSIGWIHFREKKIGEALRIFVKQTRSEYVHHSCWFGLGTAMVKMGKLQEGANALKKACDLDPNAPGYAKDLGNVYFRLRQFENATATYRNALAISFDDDPVTWHSLGLSLVELGKYDEALAAYKTAASIDPTGDSYADQMHVLIQQAKYTEALEVGREAAEMGTFDRKRKKVGLVNPRYVHRMMAEAYNRMKLYEKALDACADAERLSKQTGGGVYHLCYIQRGDALRALGKVSDARRAYKTALRGPEPEVARLRLKNLE